MPTLAVPGPPALTDARAARVGAARVHTFLQHLGRAVQRASIYPPGHPSSQGVRPLAEALALLVEDGPVTVGVGRKRLLVTGSGSSPVSFESPWLAARLFDRDVAVLIITRDLDAHDLTRMVLWLAEKGDPLADAPMPEFPGATLARFDSAKLRFRDTPAAESRPDIDKAWAALTTPLRTAYGLVDQHGSASAGTLADEIRHALAAAEGVGVGRLVDQIVALHGAIDAGRASDRDELLGRLAVLVEQLAPEVRGALFGISDADPDEKTAVVEDLLPWLPAEVLFEIAANTTVATAEPQGPFGRFLRKLAHVASGHPSVIDVVERKLMDAGVPPAFFDTPVVDRPPTIRRAPQEDQEPTADPPQPKAPFVPAEYGAWLDRLASTSPSGDAGTAPAFCEDVLDEHLARVVVQALREDPTSTAIEACLPSLAEILPREAARKRDETLTRVADLVLGLRAWQSESSLSPATAAAMASIEATYAEPLTFDRAIAAIVAADGAHEEPTLWLAAGGAEAAQSALSWMQGAPSPDLRAKVAVALMALDEPLFVAVVGPAIAEHARIAEAFTASLASVEPARAIMCALALAAHPHGKVRRRAMAWALSVPLAAPKAHLIVPRALEEGDPAIVSQAVDVAARHPGAAVSDALHALVTRRVPLDLVPARNRALAVLASSSDGLTRLTAALRARRWMCAKDDRLASLAIVEVLSTSVSDSARAAVWAWRRSPAGMISVFTRPVQRRA